MVGQISNVSVTLVSLVLCLNQSYLNRIASSLYGCELWYLFHAAISDVCMSWRKGLRRVWSLPYSTRTALLAPLSDSIPIMDDICRRTLSFTVDCPSSNCNLIYFVSRHAVNCGRCFRQRVAMLCAVARDINKLLLLIMYLTVLRVRTQFVIAVYFKSLMIYACLN